MALKLFVGGLNSKQNESDIMSYFSQFGNIRAAKVVRGGAERRSKCYGFIWLQSEDVKRKILEYKKHVLGDRVLVVSYAVDGRKNASALLKTLSQKKLFIGGLGPHTTSEDLHYYFGKFGEVHSAFVICQPQTKRSRRFGYVEFVDPTVSDIVLELPNLHIDGYKIGCRRFGDNRLPEEMPISNEGHAKHKRVRGINPTPVKVRKDQKKALISIGTTKSRVEYSNSFKELILSLKTKKLLAIRVKASHSNQPERARAEVSSGQFCVRKSVDPDQLTKGRGRQPADNSGFVDDYSDPHFVANYRFNVLIKS